LEDYYKEEPSEVLIKDKLKQKKTIYFNSNSSKKNQNSNLKEKKIKHKSAYLSKENIPQKFKSNIILKKPKFR
jgi:hypothetical protein